MPKNILARTLWYDDNGQPRTLAQDQLLTRSESLVVLGEAGMGKTELMRWLGRNPGYTYGTARKLINARAPAARQAEEGIALAIDALDELSTRGEGDGVDAVLQKLGELGYPRFVLSCRVADWRNATASSAISDIYGEDQVLVLHLDPLTDEEVHQLLADELGDASRAAQVMAHFENANLGGLLRNPQTLELVATVARTGALPDAKGALFERAVDVLRREHRDGKVERQPDQASALDAAGAAFSALILTGSDSIAVDAASPEDGELPVAELVALPGGDALKALLGTRLFATAGSTGRFSYWHRRIGEFLGSRWLAKQASSAMKRKRLIALFRSHGLVPASLRGMHAWLAYHDPDLAVDVIAADPLGLIEYGDPDALSAPLATALLDALRGSSIGGFGVDGSKRYPVKSIAAPQLRDRLRTIVNDPDGDFTQRAVILDTIKAASLADSFRDDLRQLLLNSTVAWSLRLKALEALLTVEGEDWRAHVATLLDAGDSGWQIMRAIEEVGLDSFDDELLVRCVVQHAICERSSVSMIMRFEQLVPDDRLERVLDELVRQIAALPGEKTEGNMLELNSLGFSLMARVLQHADVDARQLWQWLRPFRSDLGYRSAGQDKVAAKLVANAPLRRDIQRWVLLDEPGDKSIFQRTWRMTRRSNALALTEDDVVCLMNTLQLNGVDDQIWRDLVSATPHSEAQGGAARNAAKRLVASRPDMLAWIDKLATPSKPEWQERSERSRQMRAAKDSMRWQGHREQFSAKLEELRQGNFNLVISPAQAYLNLFADLPHALLPIDRLTKWLGEELTAAALSGFEAHLQSDEPPTAQEVAAANANSSRLLGPLVVTVGLAERVRTGRGLQDVSNDRLIVGYYETRHGHLEQEAKIEGLRPAIEGEMRRRGLIESSICAWVEPQLQMRLSNVDQIHELFWRETTSDRAADIAHDWLTRFPDMAENPEFEAIHRLIESHRFGALRELTINRGRGELSDGRRRNWDAVRLLVDFEASRGEVALAAAQDPELIFAVRGIIRRRRDEALSARLTVSELAFVISTFRRSWPWVEQPEGTTMGDRNPWDSTQFLTGLMRRLAEMTSDEALKTVNVLIEEEGDTYARFMRRLAVEQLRKLAEERYTPPDLEQVRAVVENAAPKSVSDIRATVLVLLEQIQKRIWADPVDSWRGFYQDNGTTPHNEERCRDYLLTMTGLRAEGVDLQPEGHMAADKRADIIASVGPLRLAVEVKGQWHDDLWHAADTQLDRLYTTDYAAERQGIYLAFWFGPNSPKKLRSPGRSETAPGSPKELCQALERRSSACKSGRVTVVVLDLERPPRR